MKFKELPSAERLRELFSFDVLKGELFWRESPGRRVKAGSVAGTVNKKGYRNIQIDGTIYRAHRLIWKWHYGTDPQGELDHRNQEDLPIKQNHIWCLQDLTAREHRTITQAHYKESDLPVGVRLLGNRYRVEIVQEGKNIYLGIHDTPEQAYQAYLEALEIIENGEKVVSAARPTSSQYKGVTWDKRIQKWRAQATIDGKHKHLGSFLIEIEAHQAVCKARSVS